MRLLPYFLIGMFALGVLLLLFALHQLRLRRTGAYWRLRRRAGDRGARLFLLSVGLIVLSVVLALLSGLGLLAYRNINPPPTRGPDDLYGIILSPTTAVETTEGATSGAVPATFATPTEATPTPLLPTVAPTPLVIPPTNTLRATDTPPPTPTFTAPPSLTPRASRTPRPLRTPARF